MIFWVKENNISKSDRNVVLLLNQTPKFIDIMRAIFLKLIFILRGTQLVKYRKSTNVYFIA